MLNDGESEGFPRCCYKLDIEDMLMTCHLTLLLACFSIIFSRFYQQKGEVLEQFPMIS